jgi:transposase, IS5 family
VKVTKDMLNQGLRIIEELSDHLKAGKLCGKLEHICSLAVQVIDQTERRVFLGESVESSKKVVSVFEEHTDIIAKGNRETIFGHKITLTVGKSNLILDCVVEDGNPADSTKTIPMIERQKEIFGEVPKEACFDGAYASKANLKALKEMGVEEVAFNKKRGLKVAEMTSSPKTYERLRRFRAGVEGVISFLKRSVGLSRCTAKGKAGFDRYIWSSVFSANLLTLSRHLIKR